MKDARRSSIGSDMSDRTEAAPLGGSLEAAVAVSAPKTWKQIFEELNNAFRLGPDSLEQGLTRITAKALREMRMRTHALLSKQEGGEQLTPAENAELEKIKSARLANIENKIFRSAPKKIKDLAQAMWKEKGNIGKAIAKNVGDLFSWLGKKFNEYVVEPLQTAGRAIRNAAASVAGAVDIAVSETLHAADVAATGLGHALVLPAHKLSRAVLHTSPMREGSKWPNVRARMGEEHKAKQDEISRSGGLRAQARGLARATGSDIAAAGAGLAAAVRDAKDAVSAKAGRASSSLRERVSKLPLIGRFVKSRGNDGPAV